MDLIEECFQHLNKRHVEAYEERVHAYRADAKAKAKKSASDENATKALLETGLDLKTIAARDKEREKALATFLRDRSAACEKRDLGNEGRRRLAHQMAAHAPNRIVMLPYAATLLSANAGDIGGNPGPSGNPWVMPYNPGQVRIKRSSTGSGSALCGWARAAAPGPSLATFWFPFTPDRTGLWRLLSLVEFHGFFRIFANDDWWNCKWAKAELEVRMSVFQFFWNPTRTFAVIKRTEANAAVQQIFDSGEMFDYEVQLRAGELAFVRVEVTLFTDAEGGGCFAELNFADFDTNFIQPLVTFAWM